MHFDFWIINYWITVACYSYSMLLVKYGEVFRLGKQNPSHTVSLSFHSSSFQLPGHGMFLPIFCSSFAQLNIVGLNKFSPHLASLNKCT